MNQRAQKLRRTSRTNTIEEKRAETKRHTLVIAGQHVSLRTDKEQHKLDGYAERLTESIEAMQALAPAASLKHILLLTAIQLVEQLDESEQALHALQSEIEESTRRILDELDAFDSDAACMESEQCEISDIIIK